MKRDEKLEYDIVDTEYLDEELDEDTDAEEQEKKARRKKNLIRILIGVGIIIAILLLSFGIRKSKIAAVLSDELQDEMIDDLAGYINEIAADYVNEDDAEDIAKKVIEENFGDLLLQNFMSLTRDQIQKMIDDSLHTYMKNYYTSEETDTQIDNAIDEITNLFMADLTEIRKQINGIKTEISELEDELNENVENLERSIATHSAELQEQINTINSDIDITEVETPLVAYKWNTLVYKLSSTGEENGTEGDSADEGESEETETATSVWDKWETPDANLSWIIVGETYDVSEMTIAEYVEVLASNDIEFSESFNKLYEYVNDLYAQEASERTEADTLLVNLIDTKIADLQTQIDEINEQLAGLSLWTGTQTEYNALGKKDSGTLYFITE